MTEAQGSNRPTAIVKGVVKKKKSKHATGKGRQTWRYTDLYTDLLQSVEGSYADKFRQIPKAAYGICSTSCKVPESPVTVY